ncbi:MAG: response regulator transcription factor [Nitrosomonas sp.]|nr:response regulator transcription factor [Nitrosomonas sp.]
MINPLLLVIEDEKALRENLIGIIAHYGFRVIGAPSGEEGIQLALQHTPDIIICDIMLPGVDGFDVYRNIKASLQFPEIAFIFLTAKSTRSDIRTGMDMGADDYLTKPFTKEEMLNSINARIAKLSRIREQQPAKDELIEAAVKKLNTLTKSEHRILDKIAEGLTTPQIARKLFISKKTVENHRVNISRKLDLSGPNSLINFALRLKAQKPNLLASDNLPPASAS